MELLTRRCPEGNSRDIKAHSQYSTDLSLLTARERRHGTLLFEMCAELVRTGKPGRPKKTLKKGINVWVKNTGGQKPKKGRMRPKYQSPWPEHPETQQDLENQDIPANHEESFFSALRRKCSTYRRRTKTYAKFSSGLQKVLEV